jgi:hypothetical protein
MSEERKRSVWPRIALPLIVLLIVSFATWSFWRPSLTTDEEALVGKWTLPMGPNPPPNAVQQIYWLQPGRKFLFGGRPVGANSTNFSMVGTWRVEDDCLVLNADRVESLGTKLSKLFGTPPSSSHWHERIRILGRDDEGLQIECVGASHCTLLPVKE